MGSNMNVLAASSGGSGAFNLLLLLAIPVVFYFLLIRPQSKRRREQLQLQSAVEPGVRVVTTSGMHATVAAVDDDGVVLEIAPGVEVRFVKQAVMNVVKDDAEDLDDLDEETEDADEPEQTGDGEPGAVDLGKKDDAITEEKADKPSA